MKRDFNVTAAEIRDAEIIIEKIDMVFRVLWARKPIQCSIEHAEHLKIL